jgi:hypothetical protein
MVLRVYCTGTEDRRGVRPTVLEVPAAVAGPVRLRIQLFREIESLPPWIALRQGECLQNRVGEFGLAEGIETGYFAGSLDKPNHLRHGHRDLNGIAALVSVRSHGGHHVVV